MNKAISKSLNDLQFAVDALIKQGIDLAAKNDDLADFDARKRAYQQSNYYAAIKRFETTLASVKDVHEREDNKKTLAEIKRSIPTKDLVDKSVILQKVKDLMHHVSNLKFPDPAFKPTLNLPDELHGEINADIAELNKTFDSKCFRSSVILCGRLLETALHRKYYDATGNDILEKNPGIGLGKLIAKLTEKNVQFDPGLTQQIHLINQVRISSVHKKQTPFQPSEDQARAIILFTLDTLKKLF